MFIDGKLVESVSGQTYDNIDPSNLNLLGKIARCNEKDVDLAVNSAKRAFESSEWSDMSPAERASLLYKLADAILDNAEYMAQIEMEDVGKRVSEARADMVVAARYFRFYAGIADKIHGETIPISSDILDYTVREPFGVTAHITPWNYPIQMVARSLSVALATGNTAVVKPAEDTPRSTMFLAELVDKVGFPKGVFNVVTGFGLEAGLPLVKHLDVKHITFTGSVATGSAIMQAAAANSTPLILECGGKPPHIVFPDADLENAVYVIVKSITQNAGQTCSAGSRLIVHKTISNQFVEKLIQSMTSIKLAAGIEDAGMGPIISEKQIKLIEEGIKRSQQDGDEILCGGNRQKIGTSNLYFEPTVIKAKTSDSFVAKHEVFGPLITVLEFESEKEALDISNGTPYGLSAGIWTKNLGIALRMARKLRGGQVFINNYGAGGGVEMPFGGTDRSGFGRQKGVEAINYYTQTKNVAIKFN